MDMILMPAVEAELAFVMGKVGSRVNDVKRLGMVGEEEEDGRQTDEEREQPPE